VQYASAYSSIVQLGKAVPPGREVPSLVYQLAQATKQKNVDFSSIVNKASSSGTSASAGSLATLAGFTQMPFTFVFNGSFFDLHNVFQQLNRFTLLTIQSVKLAPLASNEAGKKGNNSQLSGTITATAYVLPASKGLTGGATPTSPAGGSASRLASTSGTSSVTAPATVRVTP
jgi:hypothetical protein